MTNTIDTRTWVAATLTISDWLKPGLDTQERWRIEFPMPSSPGDDVRPFFLDERRGESARIPSVDPASFGSSELVPYIVRAYVGLRLEKDDLWDSDLPTDPGYPWSMAELDIRLAGTVAFGVEQFRLEIRRLGAELQISARNAAGAVSTRLRSCTQADVDPLVLVLREALLANADGALRS